MVTQSSQFLNTSLGAELPSLATDVVVFTIAGQQLELLLTRRRTPPYAGWWALPGGALRPDEDLEGSALRHLREKTGILGAYLEQLYTFGAPGRDPRGRVVSVAYYALLPQDSLSRLRPVGDEEAQWIPLKGLEDLAFDHAAIVSRAHERLMAKLSYSTIAFRFLPPEFTLPELQSVYEVILQGPLDKRNFRKRILAQDLIEETGGERRAGSHRPAKLYRPREPGKVRFFK